MKIEGKEYERIGYKPRELEKKETVSEPRNFNNPEPLNTSHIGKMLEITMADRTEETGKLKALGAYMLSLDYGNNVIILNKAYIVKVVIL
jgi:hypothetical protein